MPVDIDPEGVELKALREAASFEGARVLEIGCGDGRLAYRYADAPTLLVGIDPVSEDVRAGIDACPDHLARRVRLVPADALALPFRNRRFDIAVLAWSL